MREFVGVKNVLDLLHPDSWKQEALIFSRIAIPSYKEFAGEITSADLSLVLREADWLMEEGIFFQPEEEEDHPLAGNHEYEKYRKIEEQWGRKIATAMREQSPGGDGALLSDEIAAELARQTLEAIEAHTRRLSIQLRELRNLDAFPIIYTTRLSHNDEHVTKSDVVQVALRALPIPDDSTPWEQIIEYRSDPDSQSKFLALRHWMSEVARAELTPAEVEEKLEYLIDQYQKHMRLHRMKTNVGTLETIVTTGAEFLGDLVSFKWGKAAEALFSLKRRRVALLEGELTAPGNEVAYIVKARDTFS